MVLLDTNAIVFDALEPKRLTRRASKAVESGAAEGRLACCDTSLWEIAMLIAKGRLDPGTSAGEFLLDVINARRLRVLPITPEIAVLAQEIALVQGDPADRLIAATAIHHRARLVTADRTLRELSSVDAVW